MKLFSFLPEILNEISSFSLPRHEKRLLKRKKNEPIIFLVLSCFCVTLRLTGRSLDCSCRKVNTWCMSKRLLSVSFHFRGSQADNKADLYCGPLIITLLKKVNSKYFKTLKYINNPENFREYFFLKKKIKYRMVTSLISSLTSLTNKMVSISPNVNQILE